MSEHIRRGPPALQAGTQAAYSAINQAQREQRLAEAQAEAQRAALRSCRDAVDEILACARRMGDLTLAILNQPFQGDFRDELRRIHRDLPYLIKQVLAAFVGEDRLRADLAHRLDCVRQDADALMEWLNSVIKHLTTLCGGIAGGGDPTGFAHSRNEAFKDGQGLKGYLDKSCQQLSLETNRVCTEADKALGQDASPLPPIKAFVRQPPEKPEPDAQPTQQLALSDRQNDILQHLWEKKSINALSRRTTQEIAEAIIGKSGLATQLKRPVAKLKNVGLLCTKSGPDGGCWLSDKGMDYAKQQNW